jgi:putative ABC transport system ATP-binding protein
MSEPSSPSSAHQAGAGLHRHADDSPRDRFHLAAPRRSRIVGASGSGKSTLLSIIAGLDTPTTGTVRLDGIDLFAIDEDERAAVRAAKVGFVFQSFQLLAT